MPSGVYSRKPSGRRSQTACTVCHVEFYRAPSGIKKDGPNFCGHACFAAWKRTRTRELAGGWKNGTRVSMGRVKVLARDHPRADRLGYVFRYHLVMEEHIGRHLTPEEVVHHIDFDRQNDDIDNLMLFPNKREHDRHHGKIRGGLNGRSN